MLLIKAFFSFIHLGNICDAFHKLCTAIFFEDARISFDSFFGEMGVKFPCSPVFELQPKKHGHEQGTQAHHGYGLVTRGHGNITLEYVEIKYR